MISLKEKQLIEEAFENSAMLEESALHRDAVFQSLKALNEGKAFIVEKTHQEWTVNSWLKKAILLYFKITKMEALDSGVFQYHDKIPLKERKSLRNVRTVPGAIARYGSFIDEAAILMPSFVNIGAYVGKGSMVDTWATVGSCAHIGARVHLSGGVGIGGVLEPPQGRPVIIEEDSFIGSRAIIVEGVHIEKGAVIGANTVLTASTKIIDVTGKEEKSWTGFVPANSVVIPGTRSKDFLSGTYQIPAALIIGKRKSSTDKKTSLNEVLRDYEVSV